LKKLAAEPDTEAVRQAYAIRFVGAASAVLLGVAIWFLTHPQQEPGLLWGGQVYTTKEEFKGYLKSKGLSYKIWLARNPGAAPWEPDPPATAAPSRSGGAREAVPTTTGEPADDWAGRLQLAALVGVAVASGGAVLLLLWRLGRLLNVARLRLAAAGARARRGDGSSRRRVLETIRRLGLVAVASARRLKASIPLSPKRLLDSERGDAGPLPKLERERNISAGNVAFGVLSVTAAGMLALYVALLLSA